MRIAAISPAALAAGFLLAGIIAVSAIEPFNWRLPEWLPPPAVPEDQPMTAAKVELGRHLFYDKRLSRDGSQSCATCHRQELAFTDGGRLGIGFDGTVGKRNSMGLANVGYMPVLTWANPNLKRLEQQALVPMFGDNPVEMGMGGHERLMFERLAREPLYPGLFRAAFPAAKGAITLETVPRALAAFERTLISADSPYDRFKYGGNPTAISDSAKRGENLFFSEKLECYHCHGGFNFTDNLQHARSSFVEVGFHNNGLYNLDGNGAYPKGNTGLIEFTGQADHMGRFRTPSLRNVALTAPYMHDGSIATLDEVLQHYNRGGRRIAEGPHAGDGAANPFKDALLVGPNLAAADIADLKAFLESLTDETFIAEPRFANPWTSGPNADPVDRTQRFGE